MRVAGTEGRRAEGGGCSGRHQCRNAALGFGRNNQVSGVGGLEILSWASATTFRYSNRISPTTLRCSAVKQLGTMCSCTPHIRLHAGSRVRCGQTAPNNMQCATPSDCMHSATRSNCSEQYAVCDAIRLHARRGAVKLLQTICSVRRHQGLHARLGVCAVSVHNVPLCSAQRHAHTDRAHKNM